MVPIGRHHAAGIGKSGVRGARESVDKLPNPPASALNLALTQGQATIELCLNRAQTPYFEGVPGLSNFFHFLEEKPLAPLRPDP